MANAKSILLIDSNDEDREFYAERLKLASSAYLILEAATGQGAVDLYKSQSIDCVVLELSLPDISGLEVLRLVRVDQVPVVILTSSTSRSLRENAMIYGAFVVLQKDFTSGDDLDDVIQKAMVSIPAGS
jgi:CheY-like chemotaxis protein